MIQKKININLEKALFTDNGLKDFYCPINYNEEYDFLMSLSNNLLKFCYKKNINKSSIAESLWLSIIYISRECTSIFTNLSFIERSKKENFKITNDSINSNIQRIQNKEEIIITNKFAFDFKFKTNLFTKYLRVLKGFYKSRKYSFYPINFLDKKRDIIIFHYQKEMQYFAEKNNRRLNLCKLEHFFDGEINLESFVNSDELKKFSRLARKIVSKVFEKYKLFLDNFLKESIEKFIFNILKTTLQLKLIGERNSKYLTNTVILGSQGLLPYRVLSRICFKNNIQCYSLDHGCSSGWLNIPSLNYDEFEYCKNYITSSKNQKKGIEDLLGKKRVTKNIPKIFAVKNKKITIKSFQISQKPKNFLFVSTHLKKELITSPIIVNDQISIDIQIRIINKLKKLKKNVTYKPHPSFDRVILERFTNFLNVNVELRLFELIYSRFDVLIFDSSTSCIKVALESNIPIIFIDYYQGRINRRFKEKMEKRVSFININYNKKNKPFFKSDVLSKAIDDSFKKRNDTEFIKFF